MNTAILILLIFMGIWMLLTNIAMAKISHRLMVIERGEYIDDDPHGSFDLFEDEINE